MAVDIEFFESECRLNVNVNCKDITSNNEISKAFDDLDEALDVISSHLADGKIYFFGINIHGKKPLLSRLVPNFKNSVAKKYILTASDEHSRTWAQHSNESFNPWDAICPDFWINALAIEPMRIRVKNWITKLEKLLIEANQSTRSTSSLWEHDETQFGEPLVTLLALHDVEFVPCYTGLLRQWDMGSEVNQINEIEQIVRKYGIGKETEELLFCRVSDRDAQWHIDQIEQLYPFLLNQNENFLESDTFERLIFGLHQTDLNWRIENFNEYKALIENFKRRENPKPSDKKPRPPNLVEKYNFFEYSGIDQLISGAEKIIAKLDAKYPEPDFAKVYNQTQ